MAETVRLARLTMALLTAAIVAACSTTPPPAPPTPPTLVFSQGTAYRLFVQDVDVVEAYRPPLAKPNVEHEFQVLPAQIVRNWARDRIVPVGNEGQLTITIRDASVVEAPLTTTTGVKGWFTDEPNRQWTATLDVAVSYRGRFGTASAEVRTKGVTGLNESASMNARETVYYALIEDLAREFSTAMEQKFQGELSAFVIKGP